MRLFSLPKMLFQCLLFLAVQQTCFGQVQLSNNPYKLNFVWQQDSSNGFHEPHAAMLVPVKLAGCSKQLFMQFDLGAQKTIFYRPVWNAIQEKYPSVYRVADTSKILPEVTLQFQKTTIKLKATDLIDAGNKSIDWSDNTRIIIGTMGSDWLQDRTVMINYPGKEIVLNYTVPARDTSLMTGFTYAQKSILLPVSIRGKKTILFFDTGSSAFSLLTSKETALSMADKDATALRYPVQSWGRTMYANSLPCSDSIEVNKLKIALKKVTYMEGASESQVDRMLQLGIGGMTGNKLFLKHRLILDTRARKFMVME